MHKATPFDDFDRTVPVLVVKVGQYPLHHGGVGAIRSLGRVGVPVYATAEDRFTPAALSRYLNGRMLWSTTGLEEEERLLDGLIQVVRRLRKRVIAVPTDDEAAVLLAEHASDLAEWLVIPRVPPGLPRTLASKQGMHELCKSNGIPTPETYFPSSVDEVASFAERATFPVVAKSVEPWVRLRDPAVPGTTIIQSAPELLGLAGTWPLRPSVMLQEYIPREHAEDWIFHAYYGRDPNCVVGFTGVKIRSWPPQAGVTTYAHTLTNVPLAEQASRLCRLVGYRGIVDLDWRFDRRDGRYKLVDFNPRLGAQFRLFENDAGIDVVRALHLDLTGRRIPGTRQIDGRRFIVENLDAPAVLAYRRTRQGRSSPAPDQGRTELAWTALDDPLPFVVMVVRFAWVALAKLARTARRPHRPSPYSIKREQIAGVVRRVRGRRPISRAPTGR
jgi:predicted ATP-grasp superfamily ATP-dependent carboligase